MTKRLSARQIRVLLGTALFQCAMVGILTNCAGVLFTQIRLDLGLSMTQISSHYTVRSITGAVTAAMITAMFFTRNKFKFLLLSLLCTVLGFLLITVGADTWLWYIGAGIVGLVSCVDSISVPFILKRWFPRGAGTATGFAMAFSGLSGALFNPLCAVIIEHRGWQFAMLALSVLTILVGGLGLLLIFWRNPDMSQQNSPSGKQQTAFAPLSPVSWLKTRFFLICVSTMAPALCVQLALNLSLFTSSIGFSLTTGATMTTMLMVGNVAGKLLYGVLCDRFGVWKAMTLSMTLIAAATGCFLLFAQLVPVMYLASLFFGFTYALFKMNVARCSIEAYGEEGSKRYIGYHACINSTYSAVFSLLFGYLFDLAQNFTPVLILCILMLAVSGCAALIMERICKSSPSE